MGFLCVLARLWVTFDANADGGISREDRVLHTAAILTLESYRGQGGRLRRVATLAPVAGVQEAACERAGFPACVDCSRTYSDNAQASATAGVTPPQARLASAVCLRTVAV